MKALVRIFLGFICIFALIGALSGCQFLNPDGSLPEGCPHIYGDWTVVDGEFCEERLHSRTCTLCGEIDYREGTEADHYWSDPTTVEPTCSNEGYDGRTCRICDKVETLATYPIVDHDWDSVLVSEANCINPEKHFFVCQICYTAKFEYVGDPTGEHDYTRLVAFDQYHAYYCWYCNEENGREEHIYEGDSTICEICGYDYSRPAYEISLWVSERLGVASLFAKQIDRFAALYGYKINYTIEGVTEVDVGSWVVADPLSSPDLFCFTQECTNRLYNAGALAAPSLNATNSILTTNDASSILSASVDGKVLAYPMTSDNGYYMYYDPSVITNPDSLEQIIADCEAAGKKIRFAADNAWYMASFFFATGCESEWIVDEDGQFVDIKDSFNSEEGLIAMKGLMKLTHSSAYESNADICNDNTAVWITGIWNHNFAMEFGFEATDLPSFTVDGVTYHMGSFSGAKLIGVKPTKDEGKAKFLEELALYLTSYECQMERFNELEFGASNLQAQSETQDIHFGIAALYKQAEFATPQGHILGAWWDIARMLGVAAENANTEQELQDALDEYDLDIEKSLIRREKDEWSIIGSLEDSCWDYDFILTEYSENVYESDVFYFNVNDEFKIRKNQSWDTNFGSDGLNGENFRVKNAGYYVIRITVLSESEINVEILPVE